MAVVRHGFGFAIVEEFLPEGALVGNNGYPVDVAIL
jgi:hypothetical protein